MNVLVTGGAGFIGSNLTRSLVASGHRVRILDDLSTGHASNLEGLEDRIDFVLGDIRDPEVVRRAMSQVEVVFHLAALPSVERSVRDPVRSNSVNVDGTLTVLLAACDAGARRLVYASSSSVYGDAPTLPKVEDMAVSTRSPYAASKLAGEAYCRAFTRTHGLDTVSLRFFNVFGPRQDPDSQYAAVIPRFLTSMLAGEPPVIFGDGSQSRDFTFVDNAVEACLRASGAGDQAAGEVMNVACGERITLLQLVAGLNDVLSLNLAPVFAEPRVGDVQHSLASIERARALIGYAPLVPVSRGLEVTAGWFTARGAPARAAS